MNLLFFYSYKSPSTAASVRSITGSSFLYIWSTLSMLVFYLNISIDLRRWYGDLVCLGAGEEWPYVSADTTDLLASDCWLEQRLSTASSSRREIGFSEADIFSRLSSGVWMLLVRRRRLDFSAFYDVTWSDFCSLQASGRGVSSKDWLVWCLP